MKRLNKKGFSIVELVIVIAVIAILAAVMVPTFGGVIEKASASAAQQEATAAYKAALAEALADDGTAQGESVTVNGFEVSFTNDDGTEATITPPNDFGYTVTVSNGVVSVEAEE